MRMGVDYGGTKIEAVALDLTGEIRARARVPTPRSDYAAGIAAIRGLADALEETSGGRVATVGVGVPGSVDAEAGRVSLGNSIWLHGKPVRDDLAAALGRPVRLANDAGCFALSEASDGAGAGASVVFGAILGTGVGGGLVVDGKLLNGANAISGEWGHIPLPAPTAVEQPGPLCSCGRRGCVETWLAGPGFAADFARAVRAGEGDGPNAREIAELAGLGDADAEAALTRYIDRLARALAVIVNVIDPDVIALGGGVSNVSRLYEDIGPALAAHVFAGGRKTRIVPNMHGDSSGVRGAAWLWSEEEAARAAEAAA